MTYFINKTDTRLRYALMYAEQFKLDTVSVGILILLNDDIWGLIVERIRVSGCPYLAYSLCQGWVRCQPYVITFADLLQFHLC